MSSVQEILSAMDSLSPDELIVLRLGIESRLEQDEDPALLCALEAALIQADAHPDGGMEVEEVRALIPKWAAAAQSNSPSSSSKAR